MIIIIIITASGGEEEAREDGISHAHKKESEAEIGLLLLVMMIESMGKSWIVKERSELLCLTWAELTRRTVESNKRVLIELRCRREKVVVSFWVDDS